MRDDVVLSFDNLDNSARAVFTAQIFPEVGLGGLVAWPVFVRFVRMFNLRACACTSGLYFFFPKLVCALTVFAVFAILAVFAISRFTSIFTVDPPVIIIADDYFGRLAVFTACRYSGIFAVNVPVAVLADSRGRTVLTVLPVFSARRFAGIHAVDEPVAVLADSYRRRYGVFAVLTVLAACRHLGVYVADPPITVLSDVRCLAVLTCSTGEETPEVVRFVVVRIPFLARVMRVVYVARSDFLFPYFVGTLAVLSVLTF